MEAIYGNLKKWREIYNYEVKKDVTNQKKKKLTPERYFNVKRPTFGKLSHDDSKYVRTFRMVSYGMLEYSPSLRSLILRDAGYNLAQRFVKKGKIKSLDDLPEVFFKQKIGLFDIVRESLNRMEINIYECISCYDSPVIGKTLCDFEAGLIQGALEKLIGPNITKEVYCCGLGNSFCGFEVLFE